MNEEDFIFGRPAGEASDLVQIKVNITREDYVRLRSLKVLKGLSISDLVRGALGGYFEALRTARVAQALAHPGAPIPRLSAKLESDKASETPGLPEHRPGNVVDGIPVRLPHHH